MTTLTKGTILANTYEITEEIGSGGGGIVFKGRHLRLNTDIVVKKIKDEVLTAIDTRKEADTLKNLKHQYLPKVYDFIEREDGVYTVMDFILGEDMATAVHNHGNYSQKQVLKWAKQLGSALEYLHSRKPPVIHSDIKPSNIMLTPEGDVCLIDFNISLAMGEDAKKVTGISAGFSPPEQYRDPGLYRQMVCEEVSDPSEPDCRKRVTAIREQKEDDDSKTAIKENRRITAVRDRSTFLLYHESSNAEDREKPQMDIESREETGNVRYTKLMGGKIDARSDIYSLGMTLYFMLTGIEPPVDFEQRIPLDRTKADISEGFLLVLEKMTELFPESRYQNGGKYLNAVNNCHKLDQRFIRMRRKEMTMQTAAFVFLFLGILMIFGGKHKIFMEKNSAYYETMQTVADAVDTYNYDSAEKLIADAKDIMQTRIEAYEQEVYLHYRKEDYDGCIRLGEHYINTAPFALNTEKDTEIFGNIYYIVGNAYFELEEYTNAKNLFEEAITYNSKNSLYYRDYAITLAKLGQAAEAGQQLENGIALGLADDSVFMAQGEIAYVQGMYQKAEDCLQQTIRITADEHMRNRAVLLCAEVYRSVGNQEIDTEIELLEQYIDQVGGSRNFVMTEYLAEAYSRKAQDDESQARDCWQKALALFQSLYEQGYVTYQLQENMAILYENLDAFDEAEEMLHKMEESYPKRYEIYKRLACLEADRQQMKENENRDYTQMQIYYDKAIELYPKDRQDMEMQMLDSMMQDLRDGGWL